jgi:RHS repeat-associated protein
LKNRIIIYAGQYYDSETGLHYNYHRYYDPKLGRYLRADPIGLEGGLNLYSYVQNNPVNYFDPFGLVWVTIDHDYHGIDNTGKGFTNWLNRKIGTGWDPGAPMSSQEEWARMKRYKIQEWQSDCLDQSRDDEYPIGTLRIITQEFKEHPKPKKNEVLIRDADPYDWYPQIPNYTYQDYSWMHF